MKRGIYQHYSGKPYQVIGLSRHSETLEEMVVYQSLYDNYSLWVRPKSMFFSTVTHEGKERFAFICTSLEAPPTLR